MTFSSEGVKFAPEASRRGAWEAAGVFLLVAIFSLELVASVRDQSQTWDEAFHILAGWRYWQGSDYGINSEHPPFAKLLATAPLAWVKPPIAVAPAGTSKMEGFVGGRRFLYSGRAGQILFACRLAASLLTLVLALLVYEAGRRMFGAGTGLVALALLAFEPNLLAHGALVNTDAGAACCLFASVWGFFRYLRNPSRLRLAECGFAAGLCLAVKHSGVVVFPILFALAVAHMITDGASGSHPGESRPGSLLRRAAKLAGALAVIGFIAVIVLWSYYGFRFRARPGNLAMTPPLVEYINGGLSPPLKGRFLRGAILGLARYHILPEAYLYGLTDVLIVSAGPRPMFLLGKLYPTGRWFYFPLVILIKCTLAFLALLGASVLAWTKREWRRDLIFLALAAAIYLGFSMTSGLNVGVRHILPAFPFFILIAAAGAAALAERGGVGVLIAAGLVILHAGSSLASYPNYLAYSNEAWGGTRKTYRLLSDTNVDWGQGLKAIRRYLDRTRTRDCWLAYFGSADPAAYGVPCKLLPDVFIPWWGKPAEVPPERYEGTVLVGATELAAPYIGPGELNPYESFRGLEPSEILGGATLVYRGSFDFRPISALARLNRVWELRRAQRLDEAEREARAVVELAPRNTYAHYTLGGALAARHQTAEARQEFETAIHLAQTIYPEFQWFWVPFLQRQIRDLENPRGPH